MKKALIASMLLLAACGAKSGESAEEVSANATSAANAAEPTAATPAAAPIALDKITDADWDKLGYGCSCTFKAASGDELLIVGGDFNAIYRSAGVQHVCKLTDAQFNYMSERGTSFDCDGAKLTVAVGRQVDKGEESRTSEAKLTLSRDGASKEIEGTWECGC